MEHSQVCWSFSFFEISFVRNVITYRRDECYIKVRKNQNSNMTAYKPNILISASILIHRYKSFPSPRSHFICEKQTAIPASKLEDMYCSPIWSLCSSILIRSAGAASSLESRGSFGNETRAVATVSGKWQKPTQMQLRGLTRILRVFSLQLLIGKWNKAWLVRGDFPSILKYFIISLR